MNLRGPAGLGFLSSANSRLSFKVYLCIKLGTTVIIKKKKTLNKNYLYPLKSVHACSPTSPPRLKQEIDVLYFLSLSECLLQLLQEKPC